MANPGIGAKFISVNLNKSYGQRSSLGNANSSSSCSARVRPLGHGGMVVLSRPRGVVSGPKGPRLSVPPPLNLPSLRREHEGLDPSSGGLVGGVSSSSGSSLPSTGMGWTKPQSAVLQDNDGGAQRLGTPSASRIDAELHSDGSAKGSVYMPPGARAGTVAPPPSARANPPVAEKAVVLRGEDFPLLQASLPSAAAPNQKQKDLHQKHKQKQSEEASKELGGKHLQVSQDGVPLNRRGDSGSQSPPHMRPQLKSRLAVNSSDVNGRFDHAPGGFGTEQSKRQEGYLPGPLPIVRLSRTSYWADDERDTGHGPLDRDRDRGFSRSEFQGIRDRELDAPRSGLLRIGTSVGYDPRQYRKSGSSHTLGLDCEARNSILSDARGTWEVDAGNVLPRDRGDSYVREALPNRDVRDANSWRGFPLQKDGFAARETGVDRNTSGTRSLGLSKEKGKDNKYDRTPNGGRGMSHSAAGENAWDGFGGFVNVNQDSRYTRESYKKAPGYGQAGKNGNHGTNVFSSRGTEQNVRSRCGDPSNRYRGTGDTFQNSTVPKSSFSSGIKGLPLNDPILNFGREKSLFPNSSKPYLEDPFMKDFPGGPGIGGRDPFSGGLVADLKVFKRKKDLLRQADFHDPIRESFEAELERVQKMQEQERQRVIEEQARALELVRREEEERERLAREEEERRRRLEEEAREATWRAEQERLEAAKRAEEQRLAREEEKRRVLLEEERRKDAARQKLLELEARIARRQADATPKDDRLPIVGEEKMPGMLKEKDMSTRIADMGDWEDGERMVERITSSASSDSSSMNRSFEMGSGPQTSRDASSASWDRSRYASSWKRDMFEIGNSSGYLLQDQDNSFGPPRRDAFGVGRGLPRKEFYDGPGVTPTRTFSKTGILETQIPDDAHHLKGQRWNYAGDGGHYNRHLDMDASEYPENLMDKFGDIGWGHGRSCGSHVPYPERFFQNVEADAFSFGRSRHPFRQPRVLPPPMMTSMQKVSSRDANLERHGSSSFLDGETRHQLAVKKNEQTVERSYGSRFQERLEQSEIVAAPQENNIILQEQKEGNDANLRCDSQSSLSVSSPPNSPTHLSHDDLEDVGDSLVLPVNGNQVALSDNDNVVLASEGGNEIVKTALSSVSPGEDEEWVIGNEEELQVQEEYDEEEDAYQEEDEVHEGDDDNLDLAQEFEDLHSEEENNADKVGQGQILGFDAGVEVGIPSSDDFKRTAGNGEKPTVIQPISADTTQEIVAQPLVGGVWSGSDGHNLKTENGFSDINMEGSSKMIQETQKVLEDLVLQPINNPQGLLASRGSYMPDGMEASTGSSVMSSQNPLFSAVNPSLPAVQSMFSTASAVPSQAEAPVKVQFGLFSGPLLPSPVPAIQIGSIQMPLHLHPQVGSSLTQIHHPPQPPFFQFGQLRYTSPISQALLPLAPQTVSFMQPTVSTHYPVGQTPGVSLHNQPGQAASVQNPHLKDKVLSIQSEDQPGLLDNLSQESVAKELYLLPVTESIDSGVVPSKSSAESSLFAESKVTSQMPQAGDHGAQGSTKKIYISVADGRETQELLHSEPIPSKHFPSERVVSGSQAPGTISGTRGKRYIYSVRHAGSRLPYSSSEVSRTDSGNFQRRGRRSIRRTEFRVRENVDMRQTESLSSSNYPGQHEKSNFNGRVANVSAKVLARKDSSSNKLTKPAIESESFLSSASSSSHLFDSESKRKEAPSSFLEGSRLRDGNPKRNINSEEDVDAPLQSGVVRVFEQPGIETPSDEDDFIEVRSKRQMLNDRREQREKEIKAKSKIIKAPRKLRSVLQSDLVSTNSNRVATPLGGENGPSRAAGGVHPESAASDVRVLANVEVSTGFAACMVAQPLPPIGTPAVIPDTQSDMRSLSIKSIQTSTGPVITSGGANMVPGLSFEKQDVVVDNVSTALGSWGSCCINQQVMTLTQTQLDEAMKPARFDTHVACLSDHTNMVVESSKPSTSILTHDKSFSSSASPLNSLLAGEKIQFGAVTSPTILPPSSLSVSNGIGTPVSCRLDVLMDRNLSAPETSFFDKEKHPDESCVQLEDPEAEAEAAASAVAVAAISSDELIGNGLSRCSSVSVADTKSFGGSDVSRMPSGGGATSSRPLPNQARSEESLIVSLPADLCVETPSLSLWPPLPSPQNSSSPMLSHFPAAPPSHFPCYEMNPMLGGPIFAFGPHDESAGTQSQPQKSSSSGSGPLGPWQQCHSGMDSFYGPPAGFTGPFISPPGGIPGVQGPSHMVVYNHFAPVGQFGQVGLSFMGTTYLPSGKQPDWKHTPVSSSAVGLNEGDISSLNIVPGQRNPNMPAPIQHLAPGSPLLPMASPLAMFDMSPFQTSADIPVGPVQAQWSHVPASPLHSVPLSMPLQQNSEGGSNVLSKFSSHALPMEPTGGRFHEVRSSTKATVSSGTSTGRTFPSAADAAAHFPDELGLGDSSTSGPVRVSSRPSYSSTVSTKAQNGGNSNALRSNVVANASEGSGISNGGGSSSNNSNSNSGSMSSSSFKPQQLLQQQYLHPIGYNTMADQRGSRVSQMGNSGNEWQRRVGFQGRNQTTGGDKNFAASKMKQIYVAKPTTSAGMTGI